jgi:hypothetical protein
LRRLLEQLGDQSINLVGGLAAPSLVAADWLEYVLRLYEH